MNISFETPDKINGVLTMTVEKEDYAGEVEKALKDYRKKANVPGFRPGQVPMGMIKRQFGTQVKVDVVNRLLGEKLYEYVRENKIQMLGEPLPSEKQQPQDIENDDKFEFVFDIAVAPEMNVELTGKDKVTYYNITVDDELVNKQVDAFCSRAGHYASADAYDPAKHDMLKGDLRELDAEGNTKEGGITVEGAVLMPEYIKVEEQQALFAEAKPGSIITFNPRKAYPESDVEISSLLKIKKEEVADVTADFTYQVTEVSRFEKAEVNQELFDQIYGEGNVKDEADFRAKIAEGIKQQLTTDTDYKFLLDVRAYAETKVGEVKFPEALLKRVMLMNNKERGEKFVEDNFEASIKELKWHLIKEQLVAANSIKVDDADVKQVAKEAARAQFAQYGMSNVPDEYLEKYAADMVKDQKVIENLVDRAVDVKLIEALKKTVKLDEKSVSLDDFNKMMQESK